MGGGGRGGEEGTRREGAPSLIAALVEEKREGSFGVSVSVGGGRGGRLCVMDEDGEEGGRARRVAMGFAVIHEYEGSKLPTIPQLSRPP